MYRINLYFCDRNIQYPTTERQSNYSPGIIHQKG